MAEKVKYLKEIVPHLEKRFGEDRARVIIDKAWRRYAEIVAENKDEPKAYYTHTRKRIYPAISMFDALISEGVSRDETIEFLIGYSAFRAETMAPLVKRILKIPGLYKKVPRFFFNMTQKNFGPHMGFKSENQYVDETLMRFDMTVCPYNDKCTQYGCPEIVKGFCKGDDILYGEMHPKLSWERTKTLGCGDDVCDFKIRVK